MKKILPWLIIIAGLLALGYYWAQGRAEKARLEERLKAEAEKVELLNRQIADVQASIQKSEATRAKDAAAAAEREKWFRENVLKPVETATPQQLVDDGARLLGAQDISTDGKSVTMGLETWRRAVSIFLNEEEYRLVKEPRWKADQAAADGIIAGLEHELDLKDQKILSLENMKADLAKELGLQKKLTTLEKVLYAGGGFAAGKGLNALASLLKGSR